MCNITLVFSRRNRYPGQIFSNSTALKTVDRRILRLQNCEILGWDGGGLTHLITGSARLKRKPSFTEESMSFQT